MFINTNESRGHRASSYDRMSTGVYSSRDHAKDSKHASGELFRTRQRNVAYESHADNVGLPPLGQMSISQIQRMLIDTQAQSGIQPYVEESEDPQEYS